MKRQATHEQAMHPYEKLVHEKAIELEHVLYGSHIHVAISAIGVLVMSQLDKYEEDLDAEKFKNLVHIFRTVMNYAIQESREKHENHH